MPKRGPVSVTLGRVSSAQRKCSTLAFASHSARAAPLTAANDTRIASANDRATLGPCEIVGHHFVHDGLRHGLADDAASLRSAHLHPLDHRLTEAGARHLLRALHLAGEVVGHDLVADRLFD